ncbi:RNA polymerase sigma-70 factor [Chitinophaga sp. Cy-1792]|nr:RNA polymerase sigma-70 factor [Chitinophaga sp. Cy-1792]
MNQDPFITHRNLLFTVAYEMLGSATDAEDVLQETWLRWDKVDQSQVLEPRAYLIRMVTRQALNWMRTLSRRREDYVGEWLPEPLLINPEVADKLELSENVSIAMLIVLESLGPVERAVFVLREVFNISYDEISHIIDKPAVTIRQIAKRAREHVATRRQREPVSRTEQQRVVERFLAALRTGQLQQLLEVLAPDVTLVADGGGIVPAAKAPVHGNTVIANLLLRANREMTAATLWLNGEPGASIEANGGFAVASFVVENGKITHIYAIANPEKLTRLDKLAELAR